MGHPNRAPDNHRSRREPKRRERDGQVTGALYDGDVRHAFLWDSSSGLVDLGTVPGFDDSYGEAINDQGQVIGRASRWGTETTV